MQLPISEAVPKEPSLRQFVTGMCKEAESKMGFGKWITHLLAEIKTSWLVVLEYGYRWLLACRSAVIVTNFISDELRWNTY